MASDGLLYSAAYHFAILLSFNRIRIVSSLTKIPIIEGRHRDGTAGSTPQQATAMQH